jgi:Fe-S-cluster containining protein
MLMKGDIAMSTFLEKIYLNVSSDTYRQIEKLDQQYQIQIPPPFAEDVGILCPDMCINRTCYAWCQWPCTPLYQEAQQLIEKYDVSYFEITTWTITDCLPNDVDWIPDATIIQPKYNNGWCIFFDKSDCSCQLHHIKMKPYIGRIAHCVKKPTDYVDFVVWFDWMQYSNEHIRQLLKKGE